MPIFKIQAQLPTVNYLYSSRSSLLSNRICNCNYHIFFKNMYLIKTLLDFIVALVTHEWLCKVYYIQLTSAGVVRLKLLFKQKNQSFPSREEMVI